MGRRFGGGRERVRPQRGQATVELVLVLPIVVLALLAIVQAVLVAHDYVLVVHAAREAARDASVGAADGHVASVVHRTVPGGSVVVARGAQIGDAVTVTVRVDAPTDVPLLGPLLPDVPLESAVSMRRER